MTNHHRIDVEKLLADQLATASADLLSGLLSTFIQALMSAEADALCGAGYGERSEQRSNRRNGYRHRDFDTRAGGAGAPYDALKQACHGAQRERLLLVQYETLTTDPAKTMHAIYAFLDESAFEHDFDHVDYDVTDFDERAGTPGLHTVGGTVKAEPRATLLPPDLFKRFVNDAFWRNPQNIPEGLQVV
jgi:hypothetical protein